MKNNVARVMIKLGDIVTALLAAVGVAIGEGNVDNVGRGGVGVTPDTIDDTAADIAEDEAMGNSDDVTIGISEDVASETVDDSVVEAAEDSTAESV